MSRHNSGTPARNRGPRINESIKNDTVRLINETGENVGVVNTSDALNQAYNAGFDLVEISPNAEPPVCKIMDYGKYKYEQQKKQAEARKKQKTVELKEVKFRPNTDENDFQVKMRNVHKFIGEGNKVKVTLRFRGREMAHQQLGAKMLDRVRQETIETARVAQKPNMEGRQMVMILAPQ